MFKMTSSTGGDTSVSQTKTKSKSKSDSGSSPASWIKDLLFIIIFLIILYILIFIIYMFYLLLWCLDMLPCVLPVPLVDMIKRIAFFFVQITLPFFFIVAYSALAAGKNSLRDLPLLSFACFLTISNHKVIINYH